MIEIIKAVLFGIVQGITEWLPISSTGHMILLDEILKLNVSEEFYKVFEVVIQLGSIIAVVILFWKKIFPFGKKDNLVPLSPNGIGVWIKKDIFIMWFHILVSCVPAAIVGVMLDEYFEALFYNFWCVAIALIIFGIAFILVENHNVGKRPKIESISDIGYDTAFMIGIFQLIAAIFPGTSRSGATIVGALLIGVSRMAAAEYTFYLAVPVMLGASLLKLFKFGISFTSTEIVILIIGTVVAFVTSIIVIKMLLGYIRKHDFKIFGWYRILLGAVVLICGFFAG